MGWLSRTFGTHRGLVRLGLSYLELVLGRAPVRRPGSPEEIRRLVFVCHGNICRSAIAEAAARAGGIHAASFGLSTRSGAPAHPPAIAAAAAIGLDLSAHRTTRVEDFRVEAGDLLLAVETRHLRRLAALPGLAGVPRQLLGSFLSPPVPHLHDPYDLDPAYMPVCTRRIADAVTRLIAHYPASRRA